MTTYDAGDGRRVTIPESERALSGCLAGPDGSLACGCQLNGSGIVWCPTHAAAPAMRTLLQELRAITITQEFFGDAGTGSYEWAMPSAKDLFTILESARALLAKIRG